MHDRYRLVVKKTAEYDQTPPASKRQAAEKDSGYAEAGRIMFESRYTFDAFVVGEGNRLAHAAALAAANSPGEAYNPVYIYGASGMGKTHLLHAIGNRVEETRPELRVIYITAENFTNELIFAIQRKATYRFKNKYRGVDVLLIDDVQFFGRTKESQEEFFHTFNIKRGKGNADDQQRDFGGQQDFAGKPGLHQRGDQRHSGEAGSGVCTAE